MIVHEILAAYAQEGSGLDTATFKGRIELRGEIDLGVEEVINYGIGTDIDNVDVTGNPRKVLDALSQWLLEGGSITPYVAPTDNEIRNGMPTLTSRQFRLGMYNTGTTEADVDAIISAMPAGPDKDIADIEWRTANEFDRLHPLVVSMATTLGYTPEVMDDLWTYYSTI